MEGVVWAGTQALVAKVAAFGGQLLLAWLLLPEEFGVAGMASSLAAIVTILQGGGIRAVLIKRQRNMDLWARPAFWLAATLGVAAAIILAMVVPLLACFYDEPRLADLGPVLALGALVDALAVVPNARLQAALKFRLLGAMAILTAIAQALLAVILAARGFGSLSLVMPKVMVATGLIVPLLRLSGGGYGWAPRTKNWRHILADSRWQVVAALLFVTTTQVPYFALAKLAGAAAVGVYAFSSNLTTQVIALFTAQLDVVLFPSLARMADDSRRQWRAFVDATRVLTLVVLGISGLQFVVAEPAIRLLFGGRWDAAIETVKILSMSNAVLAAAIPTGSAMLARGRFRLYAAFAACALALGAMACLFGWQFTQAPLGIVAGAAVYQVVVSLVGWFLTARACGGEFTGVLRAVGVPIILTLMVALAADRIVARLALPGLVDAIMAGIGIFGGLWAVAIWVFWRGGVTDVKTQLQGAVGEWLKRRIS
jgi:O-antigen/teichoic acid export membrane protein